MSTISLSSCNSYKNKYHNNNNTNNNNTNNNNTINNTIPLDLKVLYQWD